MSKVNQYWNLPSECGSALDDLNAGSTKTHVVCDFSRGNPESENIWVVGDSHAEQWKAALFEVARQQGWKVDMAMLGGCAIADVKFLGFEGARDPGLAARCSTWQKSVTSAVTKAKPAAVFTSMFARRMGVDGVGEEPNRAFEEGLVRTWKTWSESGIRVLVLADPPLNKDVRPGDCLNLKASKPVDCAVPRTTAQPPDPMSQAVGLASDPGIRLIDLTNYFCDKTLCYVVIGGVSVYFDANHLNAEYSKLLAPYLNEKIGVLGH
nr:SGNH hydrolase domain-containing protein [Psychromicrobium silvestre]